MLVDIAPDDPDRLANVVCIYFLLNFIFIWLFGMSWLDKGECFSVFFNMLSKLSWIQFRDAKALFGFFGFQLNYTSYFPPLTVMFLTIILAPFAIILVNRASSDKGFLNLNTLFNPFKLIYLSSMKKKNNIQIRNKGTTGDKGTRDQGGTRDHHIFVP